MTQYFYTAYGLFFASEFPLPELCSVTECQPDITINYGAVPTSLAAPSSHGIAWESAPGLLLLHVEEVARYLIVENREIRIEPLPGSSEDEVRIFLLGSVLGAILHARHIAVLHASVIATERGAVLFMGRSGAGKSTLLGGFLQRGYAMLADDKAGITLNENGVPQVMPGFPLIRLTEEAVQKLQFPIQHLPTNQALEKFVLPVERFCNSPLPIHAAYALNVHNQAHIQLEKLPPIEQFEALNFQTYRRGYMHLPEQRQAHFRTLGEVTKKTRVTRVVRPQYPYLLDELVTRVEEDMRQ